MLRLITFLNSNNTNLPFYGNYTVIIRIKDLHYTESVIDLSVIAALWFCNVVIS